MNLEHSYEHALLLDLAKAGSPISRLEGVLRTLRRMASAVPGAGEGGPEPGPYLWITRNVSDEIGESLFAMIGDAFLQRREFADRSEWERVIREAAGGRLPSAAQASIPARLCDGNEEFTLGYCFLDQGTSRLASHEESVRSVLGFALLQVRQHQLLSSGLLGLEKQREELSRLDLRGSNVPSEETLFKVLSEDLSQVLVVEAVCIAALQAERWLNHGKVGAARPAHEVLRHAWFGCDGVPEEARIQVLDALWKEVTEEEGQPHVPGSECRSIEIGAEHPIVSPLGRTGMRTSCLIQPLRTPSHVDPKDGYPFLAVVIFHQPGHRLIPAERTALHAYLRAFRQLVNLRDKAHFAEAEEKVSKQLTGLDSPQSVAQRVVEFVSEHFHATEVGVLEKRGNFLSLLAQIDVPIFEVPPLYIPGHHGLVLNQA